MSESTYVIDALRTPRGRGNDKGALRALAPVDLLAQLLRGAAARMSLDPASLSDLVIGCVTQTGEQGSGIARLAALRAGWPDAVPALTINRYCASGLSAVALAALRAAAEGGCAMAGGVEMMSRVPMGADTGPLTHDPALQRALGLLPIGIAADAVATRQGYTRSQCDDWALASQQRAAAAQDAGRFRSLLPVTDADGRVLLAQDETPRRATTAASLAALPPAFAALAAQQGLDRLVAERLGLTSLQHVHHAGNAPAMADGASVVLVAGESALRRQGWTPRARILGMAEVGVDRTLALTGAVDASRLALARAGLSAAQIDLFEINESFAALMLHYCESLGIGAERVNVNGGAIALGHAMGSTGSALVGTLIDELEQRGLRHGLVAVCGAAGLATALVLESCHPRS